LEILLVIVIFSLSIALVSPHVGSGLEGFTVKSTAKKVAAALNHARIFALRDRQNYYATFTEGHVVIEPSKGAGRKKEMPIPDGVRIEARESPVVVFYPGGASSGGTFEVKGASGQGGYTIKVEPSAGTVKTYPSHGKSNEDNTAAQS
jgi:type II secretory pathway pseudopilin PulG